MCDLLWRTLGNKSQQQITHLVRTNSAACFYAISSRVQLSLDEHTTGVPLFTKANNTMHIV